MTSRTPAWLEPLLRASESADRPVLNLILVLVITVFSTLLSIGTALLIQVLFGWPHDPRLVMTVGAIAAITSFSASCPGVLFASLMSARLKCTQTRLDAALAEARLASHAKSEFLASMSHEIRTPLNGVLGMAQVLETTSMDEPQRALVSDIRDCGNHLLAIVNDVLDLSKIEAGRIEIRPEANDLRATIRSAVTLFDIRAREKGTRLDLDFDPDIPSHGRFDAVRVRQCVGNLVSNAVKFTTDGQVRVRIGASVSAAGDTLVSVCVTDTGIGIDRARQDHLFSMFSQADGSIEQTYGGTGLGLAISRRLATLMGGGITLQSEPGQGSAFTLTFRIKPCEPPTAVQPPALTDPQTIGLADGARVLIADDNAISRRVVSLLMSPLGVEIVEATNGSEALDLLATQAFDLTFLDIHMPELDGEATIRSLRASGQSWSAIPVIALTADTMSGDQERFLAMGMSGYVAKPIIVADLYSEVARVMTAARQSVAA